MQRFTFLLFLVITFAACSHKATPKKEFKRSLFTAEDLTAENLFSNNIEGPAVDQNGKLFVVNFQKDGTIGLVNPDGSVELWTNLPEKSTGNAIQFMSNGDMLVADFTGHNILRIDPAKNASVYFHDERFNQPNDLCISKKGIVYASDPNWKAQTGQVWVIDTAKNATIFKEGLGTTNGICLDPTENILYVNESVQRNIWAFDLDQNGQIFKKRLFATVSDFGFDGMKCDKEGNLYVTRYGKGTVAIFNPLGRMIQEVTLKGKNVSNIVFGGKDYRTAFVTLQDRKCMEKFRVDIPGK